MKKSNHSYFVTPIAVNGSNGSIDALLAQVYREGFLTGSRMMGLHTDESDWDYIIKSWHFPAIDLKVLENYCKCTSMPTKGFKIHVRQEHDGPLLGIVNILVCTTQKEYDAWVHASRAFLFLLNESSFFLALAKAKPFRIATFSALRELYGIGDKT